MTKVEELQTALIGTTATKTWTDKKGATFVTSEFSPIAKEQLAAALIAAHAEGVAEERERIREAQLIGYRVQLFQFPNDERNGVRTETAVNGKVYTVVPTSVLAPDKKSDKKEVNK